MKYEYKMSICMMVKDEEKNLTRCLEKLKPLTEAGIAELIVVDTGSIDNTVMIAESYTNKIYFHSWNNNFSEMRNKSISYAKGEWIFIIDADERLDNTNELVNLLKSDELDKFNTIQLNVKNLYDAKDENKYTLNISPRLFRNDGSYKYVGVVHNQPIYKEPVLSSGISLTHFGYVRNDENLMDSKFNRTSELLKKELEKDGNNLYYIYQLGVSYEMHGDYELALNEFRRAYSLLSKKNTIEKKLNIYILAAYAKSAFINSKFDEAIKAAKETMNLNSEYIDMYYTAGFCEKHKGNMEKSFAYLCKYIDLFNRYNKLQISKNSSIVMYCITNSAVSNAYFEMCKYYLSNEKYMDAYESYKNISDINQKIYCGINILIELKKYDELYELYTSLLDKHYIDKFLTDIEDKMQRLKKEETIEFYKQFSASQDIYGLLCRQRLSNDSQKFELTKELINIVDFNKEPLFYSEILCNLKSEVVIIINSLVKVETEKLKSIFYFMIQKDKSITASFEDYILQVDDESIELNKLRVIISLLYTLLLLYSPNNSTISDSYYTMFKKYLKFGITFISEIYQMDRAEFIYENVITKEDRFFIIMYLVNSNLLNGNKKSAIGYMKKALNLQKEFVKYIDIYRNEIFNDQEREYEKKKFDNYKIQVKKTIQNLIINGDLDEAASIISEYQQVVPDDLEIILFKSQIALKEL